MDIQLFKYNLRNKDTTLQISWINENFDVISFDKI